MFWLALSCRMYLLDHRMQMHPLRLINPNDEIGGMIYPSIPQVITHQIDHHSALGPRNMPLVERDHGLVLRSVDSATCNREEISCPVCGEASTCLRFLSAVSEYLAHLTQLPYFISHLVLTID